MRTRPMQLSVFAVAALAIVAVAAVMLLAGGGSPAQATSGTLSPDGNKEGGAPLPLATPTPRHAAPEPCPKDQNPALTPDSVVDSGHYALFDVYWNPVEKELTNNPCPPTVVHVPESEDDGETTPARDDRTASNINIDQTIIHIPNSAKVDLSADGTPYPEDKYQELWDADELENRNGSGTGDGMVWALPACPTDGASTGGLCISFSAALLNDADWDGDIEFLLDHVHQIDIDKQDARYTLAYGSATGRNAALWDSSDAQVVGMTVAPGEYERPTLFFTSRGTYELQVHIRGNPDHTTAALRPDGLTPVSKDESVSSDLREYIIHVGAETDLGVDVTAEATDSSDTTLDPGDNVTITVTASNAGPETAPDTKVEVSLPDGLTYSSHTTDTTETTECIDPNDASASTQETYCRYTGVWTIGELAMTNDDNTDTDDNSPTLTITAQVRSTTPRGQELAVKAAISATETVEITETVDGVDTVKEYELPVVDPTPANDMDTGTITVASISNVDPLWDIVLMVEENAEGGTPVGEELWVFDADGDTLTFKELTDDELAAIPLTPPGVNGADLFTHSVTQDGDFTGVQIEVASGASLDHETTPMYFLAVAVHDSKDVQGNADETIDDVMVVVIKLVDLIDEAQDLPLSVDVDPPTQVNTSSVTLTLQVDGALPDGATNYEAGLRVSGPGSATPPTTSDEVARIYTWAITGPDSAGDVAYEAFVKYEYGQALVIVESDEVTVSWTTSN